MCIPDHYHGILPGEIDKPESLCQKKSEEIERAQLQVREPRTWDGGEHARVTPGDCADRDWALALKPGRIPELKAQAYRIFTPSWVASTF
jgi:hypothetical protein